ncbi:hypothetical protein HYC85_027823 [Camellia sinensis]|uniref:Uncharacterized protein n=1 Tax=Camellia sinensis TaxID=4442 RepID=A0A7J7FTK0_CAMSI|nr:hypothetical protein HYC85_027823 [Camellia sinensis]
MSALARVRVSHFFTFSLSSSRSELFFDLSVVLGDSVATVAIVEEVVLRRPCREEEKSRSVDRIRNREKLE